MPEAEDLVVDPPLKGVHVALDSGASPRSARKEGAASPGSDLTEHRIGCGVWSLGEAYPDQAKLRAALEELGPFVTETCAYTLPVIPRGVRLFAVSSAAVEGAASREVHGLKELQLNDVAESLSVDGLSLSKTASEVDSVEEVSDSVFVGREDCPTSEATTKRKRQDFTTKERQNFVKHNFRTKRRRMFKKPRRPRKKVENGPCLKPVR